MIERLLERVELGQVHYLALDSEPAHLPEAARRLQAWSASNGASWSPQAEDRWRLSMTSTVMDVHWLAGSIFDGVLPHGHFDAVLAHAFLDLVDLERSLPILLKALRSDGIFYFSLNFDGLTAFLPEIDPALDREIVEAYHATMDGRRDGGYPAGDSRTGRRLLTELPRLGGRILAAGASDWVVFPKEGSYPEGEAMFLHGILDMVQGALRGGSTVSEDRLSVWMTRRRDQLAAGELAFIAHQLDVMGRVPRPPA